MTYQIESKREGSGTWFNGLAGETLGARKLVYLDSTGAWKLADADDASAFTAVGITGSAINNGKRGKILFKGFIGDADWAFASLGAPIYATSTAGELTQTQPTDATPIQIVALAFEDDLIYFDTGLNQEAAFYTANSNNYDDLRFPIANIKVDSVNPPGEQAYKGGLVFAFASNPNQKAYFNAQMPHTWKEGTPIDIHCHLILPTAGAGGGVENVKFDATYSWANMDAVFPGESTITETVDVQDIPADRHFILDLGDITATGKMFSSMLIISITRDTGVANDYTDDVYVTECDIHYKINKAGTSAEFS